MENNDIGVVVDEKIIHTQMILYDNNGY